MPQGLPRWAPAPQTAWSPEAPWEVGRGMQDPPRGALWTCGMAACEQARRVNTICSRQSRDLA